MRRLSKLLGFAAADEHRAAPLMTMAPTAPSRDAARTASLSPFRTRWPSALPGGLSTVSTATRPHRSRATGSVMAVKVATPQPRDDVVDAGDAAMGALLELEGDALGEGCGIDRALLALDQELRPLPELARGLTRRRVLHHGAALRVGSVAADAALAEGEGVGDHDVGAERDVGRVPGRGGVQLRPRRQPALREAAVRQRAAPRDDPLSRRRGCRPLPDAGHDRGDGIDPRVVQVPAFHRFHGAAAVTRQVDVAVGEPRHGRAAVEIDDPRGGAGQRLDLAGRAHRDDLPVPHRHRLGHGVTGVHGEHASIDEQQVGGEHMRSHGTASGSLPTRYCSGATWVVKTGVGALGPLGQMGETVTYGSLVVERSSTCRWTGRPGRPSTRSSGASRGSTRSSVPCCAR